MTKTELNEILEDHHKWLNNEGGERANLSEADLWRADLREADLRGADLWRADLSEADLWRADLSEADLRGADLNYCRGNNKEVKSLHIDKWDIVYTNEVIAIGCVQKSISELFNMTDEEISGLEETALEWWTKWKDLLKQVMIRSGVPISAFESKEVE